MMTYNFWLEGRQIDPSKLPSNGFENINGEYFRRIDLPNGIYIKVKVVCPPNQNPQLFVEVLDSYLGKRYAQFYNGHGGAALKAEVRQKVVEALKNSCRDL